MFLFDLKSAQVKGTSQGILPPFLGMPFHSSLICYRIPKLSPIGWIIVPCLQPSKIELGFASWQCHREIQAEEYREVGPFCSSSCLPNCGSVAKVLSMKPQTLLSIWFLLHSTALAFLCPCKHPRADGDV